MMQLSPYLTFNGNCREAMLFYRECLGGDLYFQTVDDSEKNSELPAEIGNRILHAALTTEHFTLMGTDLVTENELREGNSVALVITCANANELSTCFEKLAFKGRKQQAPQRNTLGMIIGNVTDQFGKNWLLHCPF